MYGKIKKKLRKEKTNSMKKGIIIAIVIVIFIILIGVFGGITFYNSSLNAVMADDSSEVIVEIKNGSTATDIAEVLKEKNLIKNAFTFKIYTKLNKISGMQAGTYKLNRNMNVEQIVENLQKGTDYYPDEINITFVEGKNMRWIAKTISENTGNTENDVFSKLEDENYIKTLIDKYWFLSEEILNEDIYYPLEGYLFPDTYTFSNTNVTVEEIFSAMLDQMNDKLKKYKSKIEENGYNIHKLITVASIVELEAANEEDRSGVASVIYNRIRNNMSLGSDVTTYYAIKVDMSERDLYQSELNTYNPYNTRGPRMEGKLPVGPISTVSIKSIEAALNPDNTDYLYFVADMNGKVYFGKTVEEHNKNIEKLQSQGLWYSYEN